MTVPSTLDSETKKALQRGPFHICVRAEYRRADCCADLTHRFAHSVEEGVAGVLHQMPAISDLRRLRHVEILRL